MSSLSSWTKKPLGAILDDIGDGGTPDTNKKEYFGGSIPWVVIQDIKNEISDTRTKITKMGLDSCSAKLWPAETIILSTGATIGEVGLAQIPLATKQGIHGLVCKAEIDSKFLFYKIQTLRDYLKANAQGSTIREVRAPFLKTIDIEFPCSKLEQSKIAEILSTVDRAIEQTEGLIAKQQHIKTGLMQDLLTRGIDEHGNLRSEETHEFKDSPLGRIPVEWDYISLGVHLKNIEQGWSPDCDSVSAEQGQWGVLKTTSVVWEGFQYKENKVLPDTLKPKPQYEVRNGDVLMTRGGPNSRVGVVGFVYMTQPNLMLSDKLYRLIFDNSVCPEFMALALSSSATQRHLSTLKTGLAESQTNISQEIVKQLHISLPKKTEQEQIAKVLRDISTNSHVYQGNLNKIRSLKTALMQDLLTGKVRVTPLLKNTEAID